MQGFHRTYATGAACQQRTLTPPDTWSCPTLGLACVLMSRPISPELVLSLDFWISNIPRYFSFACHCIGVRMCTLERASTTFRILVLLYTKMNMYIIQWFKKDKRYSFLSRLRSIKTSMEPWVTSSVIRLCFKYFMVYFLMCLKSRCITNVTLYVIINFDNLHLGNPSHIIKRYARYTCENAQGVLKANMNTDIPLQTAAIFFLTNFYLKQGIG